MRLQKHASRDAGRVERGDWQTPEALASRVLDVLRARGVSPDVVVEPTCGRGAFVGAARAAFPDARVLGFELSDAHLAVARERHAGAQVELHHADFFEVDWDATLAALPGALLLLGNPPWVTSATLGGLSGRNMPEKSNLKGIVGIDALTGRSNFDISEWMLLRLLGAAHGRAYVVAMLCKSSVARRVMEMATVKGWPLDGATYRIDAKAHFDAAVDAVLLVLTSARTPPDERRWAVYDSLDAAHPARHMAVVDGSTCGDLEAWERTRALAGTSAHVWRSGLKHDCAPVMELRRHGTTLVNGLGEQVDIEPTHVYPLRKGSDVANARVRTDRFVLVTQRALGEDTGAIRETSPRTWAYLQRHREALAGRRSSIYRGQRAFAIFGVGDYAFAPYKVAICGLYKRLSFTVLGPVDGRPVMLDDTSYFLPCDDEAQAQRVVRALHGARAQEFFEARVFWDAKRPVTKALLQSLSLEALLRAEG